MRARSLLGLIGFLVFFLPAMAWADSALFLSRLESAKQHYMICAEMAGYLIGQAKQIGAHEQAAKVKQEIVSLPRKLTDELARISREETARSMVWFSDLDLKQVDAHIFMGEARGLSDPYIPSRAQSMNRSMQDCFGKIVGMVAPK